MEKIRKILFAYIPYDPSYVYVQKKHISCHRKQLPYLKKLQSINQCCLKAGTKRGKKRPHCYVSIYEMGPGCLDEDRQAVMLPATF